MIQMTVTLGEALQVGAIIASTTAIVVGVRVELRGLKSQLNDMKTNVGALGEKWEKHESTLFEMFGQLQRVIGIVETRGRRL